jgi:hypothetical protein
MKPFADLDRVTGRDNKTNGTLAIKTTNICQLGTFMAACLALAACGGSSSDSSSGTGSLSLSIVDAPIHDAQAVRVNFIGAVVKPEEEPAIEFNFCKDPLNPDADPPIVQEGECTDSDPHVETIDLLKQTAGASALLLDDVEVPAGKVNWVRLVLADEAGEIVLSTGTFPLTVPSGDQTGLKLNRGFMVPEDGEAKIYIDFDVRKSIVENPHPVMPRYKLKPTLRLVQDNFGSIVGEVDAALMDTTCLGGSVYIFAGADAEPDDIDRDEGDPITSTLVKLDAGSGTYSYHVDFLIPGDYTLAFVCADGVSSDGGVTFDESADDPDLDDMLSFTVADETATVVKDGVEEIDIMLPLP